MLLEQSISISREKSNYVAWEPTKVYLLHTKAIMKLPMAKKTFPKKYFVIAGLLLLIGIIGMLFVRWSGTSPVTDLSRPAEENFAAPGRGYPSEKKVEDYFVSNLRMTPEEAQGIRSKPGVDGKVMLRLGADATIEGLLGNLEYYGLVRDKDALRYALENTTDNLPGRTDALKVGDNTVDKYAYYRISEDMTAWEIADELLNNPTYFAYDEYHYLFMP